MVIGDQKSVTGDCKGGISKAWNSRSLGGGNGDEWGGIGDQRDGIKNQRCVTKGMGSGIKGVGSKI